MTILLSAGHNPSAKGACNGDFFEHDEAVKWVKELQFLLMPFVDVVRVPTGSLKEKVNFINSQKDVKIAIEIHFNAMMKVSGSESLYYPKSTKGKELAICIQREFEKNGLFLPNRGAKEGYYHGAGSNGRKLLYFLAKTKCLSVIIEPQFIYYRNV